MGQCVSESVTMVTVGGLRLWTHFDVMDNLLCQVRGTKRVRLWPPSEVLAPTDKHRSCGF